MRIARASAAIVLLLALGAAAAARGESVQQGNVMVRFDGGISPHALPRSTVAPVAVNIETTVKAVDGSDPPPQLREISIGINKEGELFDRGLPTCRVRTIQPSTIQAARRICGEAIVGSGRVRVRVRLANQKPFTFTGRLLAFNAKRSHGKRRILAQVYGRRPPSAFVLTFNVVKRRGTFGTVIRTTLPKPARKWAYVTHFEMRLQRTYTYRGEHRSFVSAACPAPPGFPGAVYPFARGRFGFSSGRVVETTLVRNCKVRS